MGIGYSSKERAEFVRSIMIVITQFDTDTLQITCTRNTWAGVWLMDTDKLTDGKTLQNVLDCAYNDFRYFGQPIIRHEGEPNE